MTDVLDFDKWLSKTELEARDAAIRTNDRFILAMAKAARSGRERVKPGISVDPTPLVFARRIHAEPSVSIAGSPSDMCLGAALNPVGRRSVK